MRSNTRIRAMRLLDGQSQDLLREPIDLITFRQVSLHRVELYAE
jgi:hypothetical protein